MKELSILFLALMMSASVQANDALKTVADAVTTVSSKGQLKNVNVAGGEVNNSNITSEALARGGRVNGGSTAAAGGIVASQKRGKSESVNMALGTVNNSSVEAKAEARGGSQAYSGAIVAGQY